MANKNKKPVKTGKNATRKQEASLSKKLKEAGFNITTHEADEVVVEVVDEEKKVEEKAHESPKPFLPSFEGGLESMLDKKEKSLIRDFRSVAKAAKSKDLKGLVSRYTKAGKLTAGTATEESVKEFVNAFNAVVHTAVTVYKRNGGKDVEKLNVVLNKLITTVPQAIETLLGIKVKATIKVDSEKCELKEVTTTEEAADKDQSVLYIDELDVNPDGTPIVPNGKKVAVRPLSWYILHENAGGYIRDSALVDAIS